MQTLHGMFSQFLQPGLVLNDFLTLHVIYVIIVEASLSSTTIQDLMMLMCTSKFDIEEEQIAFAKE